jgi:hypothetical protein
MLLNFFNILFLGAFILAAAVQYNDPDALIWAAVYLAAVLMCIAQVRKRQPVWLPPLLLAISLVWAGTLLPNIVGQVSMVEIIDSISMKTREVEEAREIGGLLLVATWAGVLIITKILETPAPNQ